MSPHLEAAAWQLRSSLEMGTGAAQEVRELVMALGGSTHVLEQNAGQPHLINAYLVALLLTQSGGV